MAHVVRDDLGGTVQDGRGECIAALVHMSDLHIMDTVSPARSEWVELLAHDDPRWRPLLHMHRPQESMTPWALAAHVEAIARHPYAPHTGAPYDLVLSTGDNIDNGQANELQAYLAIVTGGRTSLPAYGGAHDPEGARLGRPWPFWAPEPSVTDTWKPLGYPEVPDFLARVGAELTSDGVGVPFVSVAGNHDLMRQGTALSNEGLEQLAGAPAKSLVAPDGFLPADPLTLFVERPDLFSTGRTHGIAADPGRRIVDRATWAAAHAAAGVLGYPSVTGPGPGTDTVVDLEHVRLIVLDTNHPDGDYQGSVGMAQLEWLDRRLAEVDSGRVALIASHHGAASLVNTRGGRPDRVLADAFEAVVQRHRHVLAWLVGHRHIHRVAPHPGALGGFWEISTGSVIDWPVQVRAIEVIRHHDGSHEIVCTLVDHHAAPGSLAAVHHAVAHRYAGPRLAAGMEGAPTDHDVRLVCPG